MKAFTAIVCCLTLFLAPMLMAVPCSSCAQPMAKCHRPCCQGGHVMSCCAASAAKHSPPAPANSNRTIGQYNFALLVLSALAWHLPASAAHVPSSSVASPALASSAPLYERHCALLI